MAQAQNYNKKKYSNIVPLERGIELLTRHPYNIREVKRLRPLLQRKRHIQTVLRSR